MNNLFEKMFEKSLHKNKKGYNFATAKRETKHVIEHKNGFRGAQAQ